RGPARGSRDPALSLDINGGGPAVAGPPGAGCDREGKSLTARNAEGGHRQEGGVLLGPQPGRLAALLRARAAPRVVGGGTAHGLALAERLHVQASEDQRVLDLAALSRERFLVVRAVGLQVHEPAVAPAGLAMALAVGVEGRVGDEEHGRVAVLH